MTHDYSKALEDHPQDITDSKSFNDLSADYVTWALANDALIQSALRIADRLQRGDVSEGMWEVGERVRPFQVDIFKAMATQLIKEETDDRQG